jgi:hypothetical protein
MGVSFSPNREETLALAPHLKIRAKNLLEQLRQYGIHQVPKHIILKFFEYIVVPSVNYGAFIDLPD